MSLTFTSKAGQEMLRRVRSHVACQTCSQEEGVEIGACGSCLVCEATQLLVVLLNEMGEQLSEDEVVYEVGDRYQILTQKKRGDDCPAASQTYAVGEPLIIGFGKSTS